MKPIEEKIIKDAFSEVQAFYKQHGRTPVRREMKHLEALGRRHFGTWNKFILAAGLEPNVNKSEAEVKAELLALLNDFYHQHERIPMRREFSAKSGTVTRYFGSWNKFIAAGGFEPNDRRVPSKAKLKNSLIKFHLKHKRPPTIGDCVRKNGLYNALSYYRHFNVNCWADVLEIAKLKPYFRITTMTESEAKEKVIQLIKKHRIKYYKDYNRLKPDNYPSVWYINQKFGWNNLCYLAGTKVPVTAFSIKSYYLSLAKELGRTPTTKELEKKMGVTSGAMTWKIGMPLNEHLQSIGQTPAHETPKRCKLSKKQLADLYKTKSLEHGFTDGMPRTKLQELTGYSRGVYESRFFSINGLRLVCGFKLIYGGGRRYTEAELRDILKKPKYANRY